MSWFPKIAPNGRDVIGGATKLYLNGDVIPTAPLTRGGGPVWEAERSVLFGGEAADGTWGTYRINPYAPAPPVHVTRKFTTMVAAGGRWIGQAGETLIRSWDPRPILDAANPAINVFGTYAYTSPFHNPVRSLYIDGEKVHTGRVRNVRMSASWVVWDESGQVHYLALNRRKDVLKFPKLAFWAEGPRPVETANGALLVVLQTHTGLALVTTDGHGWTFDNGGQAFEFDAARVGGSVRTVFTNHAGVLDEHTFTIGLAGLRDLTKAVPAPPAPPAPQPTPPPPPKEETPTVIPRIDLLEKWRAFYNDEQPGVRRGFLISNGYAWDRRAEGFGLLDKRSPTASTYAYDGKHFPGDIVVTQNLDHFDVLQDGDGVATPTFQPKGKIRDGWRWVPPYDPTVFGSAPQPVPVPVPQPQPQPQPPAPNLVEALSQIAHLVEHIDERVQVVETKLNSLPPVLEALAKVATLTVERQDRPYEGRVFGARVTLTPKEAPSA